MLITDDRLTAIRVALEQCQRRDEIVLDSGLTYTPNDPVRIRIRKRERRYDLSDDGAATARAGRPAGWLEQIDRLLAQDGFNVNHGGVVYVPAVEGRDIATLALRLAEASRTVYVALLELQEKEDR